MATRYSSHAVARRAGLVVVPIGGFRGVRVVDATWLQVGSDATDDEIVSVACRFMVERRLGQPSEKAARAYAHRLGYDYVASQTPVKATGERAKRLHASDRGISKRHVKKDRLAAGGS